MKEIEGRLGYRFTRGSLVAEALRHGSVRAGEAGERSYQRLEFLGDAVLNLCVAEETFGRLPEAGEGELSRARAAVISNRSLVRVGERIGVPEALRTDPSVRKPRGGGVTRKMVADAVEAIAGAIFLDGGYGAAREFVRRHFLSGEEAPVPGGARDPKSRLQEWCQRERLPLPRYVLLGESGPAHARTFRVAASLDDGRRAEGGGPTKKEAETEAAARLLDAVARGEAG